MEFTSRAQKDDEMGEQDYYAECDRCGRQAVAEITGALTETDDIRVCAQHLPKNRDRIIARWTGTYWQAVR